MAKTPDPIQELVTAARRKQILDAATQVFAEKGFHRATIKDIARVAGIADGTMYTYFTSKTEVLLGILHRLNESTEREQQLMPEGLSDMRSFFTSYVRQRMALLWPNAEVFQAVLPEMLANEELRELYDQQVVAPTFTIAEHSFQALGATDQLPSMDIPPHRSRHGRHAFRATHTPIARRPGDCPTLGRTPGSSDHPAV